MATNNKKRCASDILEEIQYHKKYYLQAKQELKLFNAKKVEQTLKLQRLTIAEEALQLQKDLQEFHDLQQQKEREEHDDIEHLRELQRRVDEEEEEEGPDSQETQVLEADWAYNQGDSAQNAIILS
jgi:hypothetical protein